MKVWIGAGLALFLVYGAAAAQGVPRIKAKIISRNGNTLVLDADAGAVSVAPLGNDQAAKPAPSASSKKGGMPRPAVGAKLTLSLMPATLVVVEHRSVRDAIKVGDFIGATAVVAQGELKTRSIVIYPDILRGSDEGRFADGDVLRVGGQVSALTAQGITIRYRGKGEKDGVCAGRAAPRVLAGQYCTAEIFLALPASIPVSLLVPGDAKLLTPGRVVTASVVRLGADQLATPGVIVQQP